MRLSSVGKSVPEWLHDIFLGYGDPAAAHYSNIPGQLRDIDFKVSWHCRPVFPAARHHYWDLQDTFLSAKHIQETFPGKEITFIDHQGKEAKGKAVNALEPPFRVRFIQKRTDGGGDKVQTKEVIMAIAYKPETPSSLAVAPSKVNEVPFSPAQVEAIRSGMNPGLSLIVGPPGTGKTDVAVQTISNLYHNFPDQRILILTHSNQVWLPLPNRTANRTLLLMSPFAAQALNDIFSKIMQRDIDERFLLRLGIGERDLRQGTQKDFSKYGRVNHCLERRLQLLDIVEKLNTSLGADMKAAEGYFTYLEQVFDELESYRAFELLRTAKLRGDYLVTKQAKIVAMTCTHAALARQKLVDLGFKFDSLIIEEAAQMMEIESFLPMLLQHFDAEEGCRLKRVTLIGDHNQLPPVVKNQAFQNYGHLDQSLFSRYAAASSFPCFLACREIFCLTLGCFTRLIRLGVPAVHLDYQGRSRPTIAELFRWRYQDLKDFEHVKVCGPLHMSQEAARIQPHLLPQASEEYATANAGFAHEYQMVNVEDFEGTGEMQPSPFFYQAEYVVAVYQYMRLCGYAAEDISILTTYNGQKHLIRDIVQQ
ncbi:Aqr, partial [Symbiodinium sp. KB8]